MYKQASEAGSGGPAGPGPDSGGAEDGASGADDDVVDADFEEVKDKK